MWNSFETDSHISLAVETITYRAGDGQDSHAYFARPDDGNVHPGIVLVHHQGGWDEFYQEFAERLARHGYATICPDLYCRYGHGAPDDVAAGVRNQGGVPDDRVVADCAAAASWLRQAPRSTPRVAIIGSCSGGRHALLTASRTAEFDAVADLWGGGVVAAREDLTPSRPVAPIDYTIDLTAPLLGLFGNDDKSPSPEDVDAHEAALREHGKSYEFHRYDGASHAFFNYHTARYRPEQAIDGWNKLFGFLAKHLQPAEQ